MDGKESETGSIVFAHAVGTSRLNKPRRGGIILEFVADA